MPSLAGPICPWFLLSDLSSNVIFPQRPTSPLRPAYPLSPPPHGCWSLSSYCPVFAAPSVCNDTLHLFISCSSPQIRIYPPGDHPRGQPSSLLGPPDLSTLSKRSVGAQRALLCARQDWPEQSRQGGGGRAALPAWTARRRRENEAGKTCNQVLWVGREGALTGPDARGWGWGRSGWP